MPFQPQKKLGLFDKWVCLGKTLNLDIYSACGGILRKSGEILGKYRILKGKSLGSKGLKCVSRFCFKLLSVEHDYHLAV